MAEYEEEHRISDFDNRYLPPREKEAIPKVLEGLQRHEQAVARNARAVDRQLNGLQTTITNVEQQLHQKAAQLDQQIDDLVVLVDRTQRNNDAADRQNQEYQDGMQRQLDEQREQLQEQWELRLEQNNEGLRVAANTFNEELINTAERVDDLEKEVQQLSATTEQLRAQIEHLQVEQAQLADVSLSSLSIDDNALNPTPPTLAQQLHDQQYARMPENVKILDHMVKYLQDITAENTGYDQQHPLVELQRELEPVLENAVSMLPLQIITSPAYDGNPKTSVFKFLQEVEDDVNTNVTFPLTQEQKVLRLRSHLRGRARQYFDSVPNQLKGTFEAACEVLKRKFNDKLVKRLADARLTACYQKADESVHAFSERLMDIINTVMEGETIGEIEKTSNREFKHRLLPRIRVEVLRLNPDTYEESLGTALQYEAYQDELKVINQMNPEVPATIMVADVRDTECFYCHRMGHLKRDCRQFQRDQERKNWNGNGQNYRNQGGYQAGDGNQGGYRNYNRQNRGRGNNWNGNNRNNNRRNYNNNHYRDNNGYGSNYEPIGGNNRNQQRNGNNNYNRRDSPYPRNQSNYSSRNSSPGPVEQFEQPARPTVRFSAQTMPLYTIFVLALMMPFTQAYQPLLCVPNSPVTLWTLIKDPVCISTEWITEQPIIPAKFNIYRQNTIEYATDAVHCKCVATIIQEWTSFFGYFHHTEGLKNIPLTTNDCLVMKSTNESRAGILQQYDGYLGTNTEAIPDTPPWPLSWSTTTAYTENCFLYHTRIFTRYGIPEIQSAFNTATECKYQKGSCNMEEQGVLIWQPDGTQNCKFVELAIWNGTFSSGVWIAQDQDFALSFEQATATEDCNKTLVLADQGFAVEQLQLNQTIAKGQVRGKREVGIVYSSQLAAEMTALQERTMAVTRQMFTATLHQICSTLNAIAEATLALASANPTILARQMLNQTNIKARLVSPRVLEISACLPLEANEVHFVPQEQCYNRLPVKFTHRHVTYTAFLDPITLILENHADVMPCETHENLYLHMNRIQRFNQRTGHAEYVDVKNEIATFKTLDFPQIMEHAKPFKNLVLANLSEVFHSQTFYQTSIKIQQMQMIMNKMGLEDHPFHEQYRPQMEAYAAHVVATGIFSFLYGGLLSLWQVWIFLSCLYITFHFITHVILPPAIRKILGYLNIFKLIFKIRKWCKARKTRGTRWTPPEQNTRINTIELENLLTTTPAQRYTELQQKWPSTIINTAQQQQHRRSSSVLAFAPEGRSPAHVQGNLNGHSCLYLLDTGAKRSIVNQEYVNQHGLKIWYDQPDIQLMGIEGRPIITNGYVRGYVQLAGIKVAINLHIFPGPNKLLCASDVILGEDAFQRMPPITFDYANRMIYFKEQQVPLFMVDGKVKKVDSVELKINKTDATPDQQKLLFKVLAENVEAISLAEYDIGKCTLTYPTIEMLDKSPMVVKPYRVPEKHKEVVKNFIEEMLKADLIEETNSPWLSNLLVVPKPEGRGQRICLDLRPLNARIQNAFVHLGRIEDLLNKAAGHKFFTNIDMVSGYYQIRLDEESKKYCSFISEFGNFAMKVLPFGLKTAPSNFTAILRRIFKGCEAFVLIFLDDILIIGQTFMEHLENIRTVLQIFVKYGLKLKLSKSNFCLNKVTFCGHVISSEGITLATKHIEAIKNYPVPKSQKQLQQMLGLASYFRRFIKNFAFIAEPLTSLLPKNVKFIWTKQQQEAFEELIKKLSSYPVLRSPDFSKRFVLQCDASDRCIGGALLQQDEEGQLYAIGFMSKLISGSQRNYATIEKELMAIVESLKYFHHIIWAYPVDLMTDHKPLIYLFHKFSTNQRLNRWLLAIQQYDLNVTHVKGADNILPDKLSRIWHEEGEAETTQIFVFDEKQPKISPILILNHKLRKATRSDKIMQKVINAVTTKWSELDLLDPELKPFVMIRDQLSTQNEFLLKGCRTVIPPQLQQDFLDLLHLTHMGVNKMKKLARTVCWWPNINANIEEKAATCKACNELAREKPPSVILPWPKSEKPLERVHMDFAGKFLDFMWLILIDTYSKYPIIIKMTTTTSFAIIQVLAQVFNLIGFPNLLVNDNAANFKSEEFAEFCALHGIRQMFSPPYNPRSNGQAENFVKTFKNAMKRRLRAEPEVPVMTAVTDFLLFYRNTPHSTTNIAPAIRFFGRKLIYPLDAAKPSTVTLSQKESKQKSKETAAVNDQQKGDETNMKKEKPQQKFTATVFKIGDKIWFRSYTDKRQKWKAGTITGHQGQVTFYIEAEEGGEQHVHHNQLRLRRTSTRNVIQRESIGPVAVDQIEAEINSLQIIGQQQKLVQLLQLQEIQPIKMEPWKCAPHLPIRASVWPVADVLMKYSLKCREAVVAEMKKEVMQLEGFPIKFSMNPEPVDIGPAVVVIWTNVATTLARHEVIMNDTVLEKSNIAGRRYLYMEIMARALKIFGQEDCPTSLHPDAVSLNDLWSVQQQKRAETATTKSRSNDNWEMIEHEQYLYDREYQHEAIPRIHSPINAIEAAEQQRPQQHPEDRDYAVPIAKGHARAGTTSFYDTLPIATGRGARAGAIGRGAAQLKRGGCLTRGGQQRRPMLPPPPEPPRLSPPTTPGGSDDDYWWTFNPQDGLQKVKK